MNTDTFERHTACDACGSSDANAVYSDGHTYCFACQRRTKGANVSEPKSERVRADFISVEARALTRRKIDEETCKAFGYGVAELRGETVQVAEYRNAQGELVGQKIRTRNKDFRWIGKSEGCFFGQHVGRGVTNMIVITEGEIDAMSVGQMQGLKWPVVSVPDGAASAAKAVRANIEWLERFEKVVLFFDMDEPGRTAARECAEILSPGKAFIASITNAKDANDLLMAGRGGEIIDAIWRAKEFRPDGVLDTNDVWERLKNFKQEKSCDFPWRGLNDITHGLRRKEITTIVAGTGVGKTEVVRTIVAHAHDRNPGERIGIMSLEESIERTALGFMGLAAGRRLHLDPALLDGVDRERLYKTTVGSGRYFLYDHVGAFSVDGILAKIRFMARGCGCTIVVLDNLTIVSSGIDGDERKALDLTMTKLKALSIELDIAVIVVHHLKRLDSKATSHEEGGQTSLSHVRGTGGIGNYSNTVIGLERNQQHEDPAKRNTTRVRVLKCRHTGKTGLACGLRYDVETGLLHEVSHDFDDEPDDKKAQPFGEDY